MHKILVIEGHLVVRKNVTEILTKEGYEVFQAKDGKEGFEMALKELPCLIISEVFLSKISGFRMFEKLKNEQETANIPLIFLSEKDTKEDLRAAMNTGAVDYLTKPLNTNEFLNVIKRSITKQEFIKNKTKKLIEENDYLLKEAGRMAKIGYWSFDNQTKKFDCSDVAHQIFGVNPKMGQSDLTLILNCFSETSRQKLSEATLLLAKDGAPYDIELKMTNLKNEKRWIQYIGEAIYNNEKEIISCRGIVRDITRTKNDQEALKKSNERFELVAHATNEAIWDWDLSSGEIYRSKIGFDKVFGFDNKENRSIKHWDKHVQKEDKTRVTKLLNEKITAVDQSNFSFNYWFIHPNGKPIYVNDKGFIVRDKNGKAIRIIGAASNITERKKEEVLLLDKQQITEEIAINESLKTILETITRVIEKNIPDSICAIQLIDLDGEHLHQGAAPNLPNTYNLAIEGIPVRDKTGSSGTAAFKKEMIFASDINTDPRWIDYKELALSHGLKACWSMPIISNKDTVLGTISVYFKTIKKPKSMDVEFLKKISKYARIAIEKENTTNILIHSETKYRNLFERNLAGTYQSSIDGKILSCNTTFANMLGYATPKELQQEDTGVFYFFDTDLDRFLKELKEEEKMINLEMKLKRKDGTAIYVLQNCYLQTDIITNKKMIEGVMIDITKRKKIQQALEESFSNLEAILESTADGLLVVDNDGRVVRFNKKFIELWQISREVMLTMNDEKVLNYIANQLKYPQKVLSKVKELYNHPETESLDIIELKNGRVFERYSQPKILNGVNIGRVWSFRNITESVNDAKEKQQLFALIETSKELITFGNLNGNPIFINKAGRKMLGVDENKKLSDYHFTDFFAKETKYQFSEIFQPIFKEKGIWEGDTYLLNLKTKKKLAIYMSAFVIKDNSTGKAIGMGSVALDITERERNKGELIEAVKKAEKLSGFKDQFLANMSHEIRTPLSIIIGFTKILLRNVINEKQKKQLTAIKTSGDTLLVVINDILDLAKIEAGKMILEKTEIALHTLVYSLLNTFELRLDEKELKIHTEYDKNIPKELLGDPVRFNQILFNLIDNAVKFSNKGSVINIKVNLIEENHEEIMLEIIVSDTGIGIAPENLKSIFSQYTQSNSNTTRKYGGSGLGLNIVKQLIDLMNGTIVVQSELSVGSTFTFTFPLLKPIKVALEPEKRRIVPQNSLPLKRLKILIVDDMLVNQFLAETILLDLGFATDTADNGKIAIELLEKNDYDVILMDLQMPEMNGWEATKHIRNKMQSHKATTPIIALTADITKKDVDRCEEVGMNTYVSKPINETDLLDKIVRLTAKKKAKVSDKNSKVVPICNLDALKKSLHNKPILIIEMLQMILKETPLIIKQIALCSKTADWDSLQRKIHSIQPTLQLLGLPKELLITAKKIEESAKEKEKLELIPAQFIQLEQTLLEAFKELEKTLKIIKTA